MKKDCARGADGVDGRIHSSEKLPFATMLINELFGNAVRLASLAAVTDSQSIDTPMFCPEFWKGRNRFCCALV